MKISELQTQYNAKIDELQKQVIHHSNSQHRIANELKGIQDNNQILITIYNQEGDRELTGEEVLQLSRPANV